MERTTQKSARNPNIDLGRLIACYAVILIHQDVESYGEAGWLSVLLDQASRWAVPFFFLMSGYFAPQGEKWTSITWKFFKRLAPLYFFWLIFYLLVSENPEYYFSSSEKIVRLLLFGGPAYHLWFIPSLGFCALLASPFLQKEMFGAMFAVGLMLFLFGVIIGPYAPVFCGDAGGCVPFNPRNGPFFGFVFFGAGVLFRSSMIKLSVTSSVLLLLLGAGMSAFEVTLLYKSYGADPTSHDFILGTLPYSVGVAGLFLASRRIDGGLRKFALIGGPVAFGIYALHAFVLSQLTDFFEPNSVASGVFVSLATFGVSTIITLVAVRVPVLSAVFR